MFKDFFFSGSSVIISRPAVFFCYNLWRRVHMAARQTLHLLILNLFNLEQLVNLLAFILKRNCMQDCHVDNARRYFGDDFTLTDVSLHAAPTQTWRIWAWRAVRLQWKHEIMTQNRILVFLSSVNIVHSSRVRSSSESPACFLSDFFLKWSRADARGLWASEVSSGLLLVSCSSYSPLLFFPLIRQKLRLPLIQSPEQKFTSTVQKIRSQKPLVTWPFTCLLLRFKLLIVFIDKMFPEIPASLFSVFTFWSCLHQIFMFDSFYCLLSPDGT